MLLILCLSKIKDSKYELVRKVKNICLTMEDYNRPRIENNCLIQRQRTI